MTAAAPESDPAFLATAPAAVSAAALEAGGSHHDLLVLAAAPAAALAWWYIGVAAAVPITLVGAIGAAAAFADARTSRIPNRLILAALAVLGASWVLVSVVDDRPMMPLLADLAAGLVLSGAPALFVVWLVAPRVLGGGDWKLLSVLGMAVSFVAPLAATVIVMGAFLGGLVVVAFVRRRNIILGPPLVLGYAAAVAAMAVAPDLFDNWYR